MTDSPVAQRPRGTQDILPAEQPYWEAMRREARRLAHTYGYRRIDTPIFEATDLFVRGAGETTDIVTKEMYTFKDRGDRSLTLRPEGTAPIVRAYFEGRLDREVQPVRLYYLGPYFRYDRPQAGRYRQLHQFGVEVIGEGSPVDDEVIELGWRWFVELGIKGVSLQLNSIGDEICRPAYRELLRDYYRPYLDQLCEDDRVRFERNPLRMLDCKVPSDQRFKAGAPRIVDHLCGPCAAAFEDVKERLTASAIPYTLNPGLVRGLDYYTRTVFEYWHESLAGAQNSIGAGGRYDGLAAELGYRATPGLGFALGLDRTALILKQYRARAYEGPDVYAIAVEPSVQVHLRGLVGMLRAQTEPVGVLMDNGSGRLDARLRRADRLHAKLALILGPEEEAGGVVRLRRMAERTEQPVAEADLIQRVREALGR